MLKIKSCNTDVRELSLIPCEDDDDEGIDIALDDNRILHIAETDDGKLCIIKIDEDDDSIILGSNTTFETPA